MAGHNATFLDLEKVLEHQLKTKLFLFKKPLYILLDEVHFLNNWSTNAKTWHDKCNQLVLVCTGSSAVNFWANADMARRAQLINIRPLSLTESINLKLIGFRKSRLKTFKIDEKSDQTELQAVKNLQKSSLSLLNSFKEVLTSSPNSQACKLLFDSQQEQYRKYCLTIKDSQSKVKSGIDFDSQNESIKCEDDQDPSSREINFSLDHLIDQYLNWYMSLPYIVSQIQYEWAGDWIDYNQLLASCFELPPTENDIRLQIRGTLDNITKKDINVLQSFNSTTRTMFPALLIALANSNQTNLKSLSTKLGLKIQTLQSMLQVLQDAQVITAVPPLGASFGKISKTYKYIFNSPALRQALCLLIIKEGNRQDPQVRLLRGRLLEDAVYMYLSRILDDAPLGPKIEYDAAKGGADFVVMPADGTKEKAIVLEVGYNKRSGQQVRKTLSRVGSYGLVITNTDEITISADGKIIYLPLNFFLTL